MLVYFIRRLLLVIPTLLGILTINFLIVQAAPGGPVEQTLAKLQNLDGAATANITQSSDGMDTKLVSNEGIYRASQGLDADLVKQIEKLYGFDKPWWQRYLNMLKGFVIFDFGHSFYKDVPVIDLIIDKLPVSISLGVWSTLIIYLVSIPLGISKAVRDGSRFDLWTSSLIIVGYAIPGFLFAILLIVLFAGGSYLSWFPLRGLVSDNFADLPWYQQVLDYLWHIFLPVLSIVIGGFATLTILVKNSFLEEIHKHYVITARAKGAKAGHVLYGHIFRNAMLIVIAGMPVTLIGMLFTGSLLTEVIFSLDGLGLLSFESVINRDYPVVFASLYIFTLLGLLLKLISDMTYMFVDPRIDFSGR